MKKLTALLLAVVLALALVACGGGNTTTPPSGGESTTTTTPSGDSTTETKETAEPTPDTTEEPEEEHINEFAIEDFRIIDIANRPDDFQFQFKIRNLLTDKVDRVMIYIQFFDKQGDILGSTQGGIYGELESGQAATSAEHGLGTKIALSEVNQVKIYQYGVVDNSGTILYFGKFSPALVLNMEDIEVEEGVYKFPIFF